jgi:hypothetical protein
VDTVSVCEPQNMIRAGYGRLFSVSHNQGAVAASVTRIGQLRCSIVPSESRAGRSFLDLVE